MASQKELRDSAQRIFEQLRNNLLNHVTPGNPHAFAQGTPSAYVNSMGNLPAPYKTSNGMGLSFNAGQMPNEKQISDYVQSQPEYLAAVAKIKGGKGKGGGTGKGGRFAEIAAMMPGVPGVSASGVPVGGVPAAQSEAMRLATQNAENVKKGWEEAKAANEARWEEGHGELTGARDYRQELYQNYGTAAQQDIDERMQENLQNIRSQAQARGLSNSNVPLAFQQRNARDTAREQQRVRETRDTRLGDSYVQDTGNLVNFVERREDPYPDQNQAMQLAIQMAESEANRQAEAKRESQRVAEMKADRGTGGRGRSDYRLPNIPGPQGGVSPIFANYGPLQMANAMFANGGVQRGVGSNRYPTKRTPEEYAAIKARQEDMDRHVQGQAHGKRVLPQGPARPVMPPGMPPGMLPGPIPFGPPQLPYANYA